MLLKFAAWTVAGVLALSPLVAGTPAHAQPASPNQPITGISVTTRATADGTITAIEAINSADTDFKPLLTSIAQGNPDVLYFPDFNPAVNQRTRCSAVP